MRTLLVMRGAPGAGKTTWIANHGLADYTISPDDIRVLCSSTTMQPTGEFKISQEPANEQFIWREIIFKVLEYRMSRGELTVIDATASKTKDIKEYKDLADKYRYRVFVVDFTLIFASKIPCSPRTGYRVINTCLFFTASSQAR